MIFLSKKEKIRFTFYENIHFTFCEKGKYTFMIFQINFLVLVIVFNFIVIIDTYSQDPLFS